MSTYNTLRHRSMSGLLAGVLGGLVYGFLVEEPDGTIVGGPFGRYYPLLKPAQDILFGVVLGIGFGLLFGKLATKAGSGLLWGAAYALICYGLLFRREAYNYGAGLAWGLVYGLLWWFLGPLTLMPILLGAEVQWSLASALGAYPSLIGHLAYGGTTALVYQLLVMRYDPGLRAHAWATRTQLQRKPSTSAPAVWVVVLTLGIMLPLVFAE